MYLYVPIKRRVNSVTYSVGLIPRLNLYLSRGYVEKTEYDGMVVCCGGREFDLRTQQTCSRPTVVHSLPEV